MSEPLTANTYVLKIRNEEKWQLFEWKKSKKNIAK